MAIYCDTHVHCYDFSEIENLFAYAYSNVLTQGFNASNDQLVLFFTDGKRDKTWSKLQSLVKQNNSLGQWHLQRKECNKTLSVTNIDSKESITLVASRQINSSERLEFLVLGYEGDDEDGATAEKIIEKYSVDYLLICPWGVGKWLFSRGKLLTDLLKRFKGNVYLGDNGGRPWFWKFVPHFKQIQTTIFNGSDPLPLKDEIKRVASFGLRIDTQVREQLNAGCLIDLLKDESVDKTNFGKALGMFAFFKSRVSLSLN